MSVCVDSDVVDSTDRVSWSSSWYVISMSTDALLHAGIGASCGVGKRAKDGVVVRGNLNICVTYYFVIQNAISKR
jgi:hypothetical protein